ncbi:MAG: PEP-CTERM sorting domain-containing protein [Phycisphaerae bacterium]|jgi:hypothetical protein|nr:PEP-CTERM sorting domain-containing protein [Phycisphaerae bacterium]
MEKTRVMAICLISVTALLAGDALGDDFAPPPWVRGDPLTTATEWEFLTDANSHTISDGNTVTTVEGGFGPATVSISGAPGNEPVWSIGDGDGKWTASLNGPMDMLFEIGNWEDLEPVKYLRIQVTYGGSAPSISSISAAHQTVAPVVITPTGTTNFSTTQILFEYEMNPNPFFEIFIMETPPGSSINQVVVDTISTPEPATLSLLGLGGLAVLRRRKRRTI